MAVLSRLIDFAAVESAPAPTLPEDLPGYAEGYAAGRALAESETSRQTVALCEALTATVRTEAQARCDVALSLRPLFDAIGRHILPRTAPIAMVEDIASDFRRRVDRLSESPVILRVSPADEERLRDLLPSDLVGRIDLQADPDLAPLCLVLGPPGDETIFDRGALIARITTLFDAFFDHITESETDG